MLPAWLVLLGGAALTYALIRRWTTLDLFKIPSPWGIPFLGQLPQLAACAYNPHEQFLKWHDALGSIVRLRVAYRDVILIADPQVAAQVLAKGPNECHLRAPEYATYDAAHGMPGHHAIMTEHNEERWRAIRKGIAPAYSMTAIRDNYAHIVRCYAHVCQRISDGTAWLEPPAAISPAAAAAASKLAAAVAASKLNANANNSSDNSNSDGNSNQQQQQGAGGGMLRRSSSIELSRQSLSRTCSIDNAQLLSVGLAAAAAAGRAVCVDEEIFAATMHIFTEGFLGISPDQLRSIDYQQAAADVGGLIAITNSFLSQPWKQWLFLTFPGLCEESRTFHAQRSRLMELTDTLAHHVEEHRTAGTVSVGVVNGAGVIRNSSSTSSSHKVAAGVSSSSSDNKLASGSNISSGIDSTLIGCLAKLREPDTGELFSHQALQAELFLETVGQESIPWTTAWTLFLLIQHPDVEAKVMQELRSVGVPCNGDVAAAAACLSSSMDVLKQLPYCTAVLQESMRMFPAGVMAASRITHQVTQVGPYRVPAGVIVFPCLYSILMSKDNWDNAADFKPERWLTPQYATDPSTGATRFVPFGIGPKACIAQQLAYVQLKVLLVLLVSSFSWELAPCMGGAEGVLASTMAALELRVVQGMWLRPTPRRAAANKA